ncbi:acetoin dehydrogenase E2 subunit dihydrolipoyllysine-residue acetyltransferase [Chromobacterium violaceum]|uniref:Acetoin dehydrogenase E2 subunit dihydrolipoyllysine-residue acetyltransferase n=1 Tax=Chromobacterium violaceum TaxID=536 RepID=A0A3S4LLU3_CHRVL|nr:acetoin dehydrogenase E2 subunit dihydrolipoyllysine-residue acetyltransferase [Chromobacterium violaceum]
MREFDLYGHSMGGSVAIELATLLPDRIRRLVLAEPNLDSGGGAYSRALASWSEADYVARGHREIIRTFGADSPNWAGSMAIASPLAVHRAAKGLIAGSAVSWREQLRALSMPRRIIFGENRCPIRASNGCPGMASPPASWPTPATRWPGTIPPALPRRSPPRWIENDALTNFNAEAMLQA